MRHTSHDTALLKNYFPWGDARPDPPHGDLGGGLEGAAGGRGAGTVCSQLPSHSSTDRLAHWSQRGHRSVHQYVVVAFWFFSWLQFVHNFPHTHRQIS